MWHVHVHVHGASACVLGRLGSQARVGCGGGGVRRRWALTVPVLTWKRPRETELGICSSTCNQALRQSGTQAIKQSGKQALEPSSTQALRHSGHQTIGPSDHQAIRRSDHRAIRQSG
eukprot:3475852-Prymnesium_polylepis.1